MKGYSLLELSIVVVIMALLMVGVSSGNTILEKAKLHSTIKELKEIEAAIILFKEQYTAYPGDFRNAHYYLNDDDSCGTESECNGDGDEEIEVGSSKSNSEVYRSFQHLNLASLIKIHFSGIWGESNSVIQASIGGNYTLIYDNNLQNIIKLGKEVSVSETSDGGALLPKDAEKIDKKIDDGFPNKGDLRGMSGFNGGSKTNAENYSKNCIDSSSRYKVNYEEEPTCSLGLRI